MNHSDPRVKLQTIMSAWLPVSAATLGMVVEMLPSPVEAQKRRIDKLWPLLEDEDGKMSEQALAVRRAIEGTDLALA
jgi:ribosome assembly protein 1